MVAQGYLRKYPKVSGVQSILVENSIFVINTVDSILSGKHYVRSLKRQHLLK